MSEVGPALRPTISVVVPTYLRPEHMVPLLQTLSGQSVLPAEVIIVDAAPPEDRRTEEAVARFASASPLFIRYVPSARRSTTVQRNLGTDLAGGELIALVDDDIRLEPDFFQEILRAYAVDTEGTVGGIAGYRVNLYRPMFELTRWRWYRRLHLFGTYEPGRYDASSGYPINQNLQPPFRGVREVDFITTACAVWRRAVFDGGLRFAEDLAGYAVVEDLHLSLRARRQWRLLQCGSARCWELRASGGRENRRQVGYKQVYNYRYVFVEAVPQRTWRHEYRFWRFQALMLLQVLVQGLLRRDSGCLDELYGRLHGIVAALSLH